MIKKLILFPFNYLKKFKKSNTNFDELAFDSGGVFEINRKKTAIYKDSKGNITKLSPTCTHLGCHVEWQTQKKVWECPCHGAKFDKDGQVINGPAKKPLEKIS